MLNRKNKSTAMEFFRDYGVSNEMRMPYREDIMRYYLPRAGPTKIGFPRVIPKAPKIRSFNQK